MSDCIVYSSRTGNTRAVAQYLAGRLSLPMFPVEHAPSGGYDRMILGFWTWRGGPDEAMLSFMETLKGQKVFFFGTMAAFPDSPHAMHCAARTRELLERSGCTVLGYFFCQGRLDPQVLERSAHPRTPERMARIRQAALHPDAMDFRHAEESVLRAFASERRKVS